MARMMNEFPATIPSLVVDLAKLGVKTGMTLVVHSSLRAMGNVNGGPVAVILALEEMLGPEGTLVMPTFSKDNTEPSNWRNPPVPETWWEPIRATMPPYDVDMTPTFNMGMIAETFRKQPGVLRSSNPEASFAAWGKHAEEIIDNHALHPLYGEQSPLARVYGLDGWVLLLGVGHNKNSSLHLAEGRAKIPHGTIHLGAPIMVDGTRYWMPFDDIAWDASDFDHAGSDFARETGLQIEGKVAKATALLMPQRALVDYAMQWFEAHRTAMA